MGNATQARLNDGKSHKAQGKAQLSQWEARIWHKHLRACDYMVCHPTSHCLWYPIQLGPLPVDFVMAYPQAPITMDMYMELPTGIHTKHRNSKDHVLKLLANIYGQKQAGCMWNSYLVTKIWEINFKQSLIDDCVFYWDDIIFIVYLDRRIFLGSSDQQLRDIINKLCNLKLSIEDQGHQANYVGVSIKKLKNGVIELIQQALIASIISAVALGDSKVKAVPAKVSKILHTHLDKPPFSLNWLLICH
jgi:hypothetical protein